MNRVARYLLIMRAVAGEATLEQGEGVDGERAGGEGAVAVEEGGGFAGAAAFPAGQRDVRMIDAPLGLQAGGLADALDLGGERGDLFLWPPPRPTMRRLALVEAADALDAQFEGRARGWCPAPRRNPRRADVRPPRRSAR